MVPDFQIGKRRDVFAHSVVYIIGISNQGIFSLFPYYILPYLTIFSEQNREREQKNGINGKN